MFYGLEILLLFIETKLGAGDKLGGQIVQDTKTTFGITPEIAVLEPGTIAKEFERNVKAARFLDRRS